MESRRRATMPPALMGAELENAQASMVRRKQGQDKSGLAAGEPQVNFTDFPQSPSSPTTTVVRRMVKAQPNLAVVHTVSLKDGVDAPMTRQVSSPDVLQRPSSSGAHRSAGEFVVEAGNRRSLARRATLPADVGVFAEQRRSSSAAALREMNQRSAGLVVPPPEGNSIRVLEPWEVADRSQNALEFFKEAKQINRKARTIEDTELMLAEARRRRAESRSQSKEAVYQPTMPSAGAGATRIQQAMASRPTAGPVESKPAEASSVEKPPERKMTLAEKMGYGVKTTQAEDKFALAATVAHAAVKIKKGKDVMVGVAAGNNTLKERLAKRRATIQ